MATNSPLAMPATFNDRLSAFAQTKPSDRDYLQVLLLDEPLDDIVAIGDRILSMEDAHEAALRIWGTYGSEESTFLAAMDGDRNIVVTKKSLIGFIQQRRLSAIE